MHRRFLPALVLTLTLGLSVAAFSTTAAMRVGSFDASGTGTLVAQGSLTAFGKMDGSIIVRDRVGGAVVKINAIPQRPKLVRVGLRTVRVFTIRKARGPFYVRGANVRIELRAPKSPLSVAIIGRGAVLRLDGDGTYTLNTDPTAQWIDAELPIHIKPARRVGPDPTRTITAITPTGARP